MRILGALLVVGAVVVTSASSVAATPSDSSPEIRSAPALDSPYPEQYIEAYRARYYINADGTVDVTIDFTFNPNGVISFGPFLSYPIRVPYDDKNDRFYNISNVHASSPSGAPANISRNVDANWVYYKIGDPDRGHLLDVHRYHFTYTVDGLLDQTTARDYDPTIAPEDDTALWDEFYVNVIGDAWEIPLDNVTIIVEGDAKAIPLTPPGSTDVVDAQCFTGNYGSTDSCSVVSVVNGVGKFSQTHINPGQSMTVAIAFPAGSFDTAPIIRNKNDFLYAFSISFWSLTGFALMLALSVLWLRKRIRGTAADEHYAGLIPGVSPAPGDEHHIVKLEVDSPVAVRFDLPKGLLPGHLGTLIDAEADVRDVTATIVDLAVRGYMRIEEVVEGGMKRSKDPDYTFIKLKDADDALVNYEATLFRALFRGGEETTFEDLKTTFAASLYLVRSELYEDVSERGWFRRDPRTARARWVASGRVITVLGIGLTIALAYTSSWALVPLSIVVFGIMVMSTAKAAPVRKAEGTRILAQAKGFKTYLSTADGNQLRFEEGRDIFSKYLPYAIAFGVADKWTATFAKLAEDGMKLAQPRWYAGPPGNFWIHSGSFGQRMNSFGKLAHAAMTAHPPHISGAFESEIGRPLRIIGAILGGGGGFRSGGRFSGGGRFGGGGGGW